MLHKVLNAMRNQLKLVTNSGIRPTAAINTTINALGYQPFIIMDINDESEQNVIVCRTQNDLSIFIPSLIKQVAFKKSLFLQSFNAALHDEFYDAGEGFFNWIEKSDEMYHTNIHLHNPLSKRSAFKLGFPMFSIATKPTKYSSKTPALRAKLLFEVMRAYDLTGGNDATRWKLIEGLALGLCKYLGSTSEFQTAKVIVHTALKYSPKSLHLRAAEYAVACKLKNIEMPARFQKFIGHDNGALLGFICSEPFTRFDIGPSGDVLVCCGHWLPTVIGNFLTDSVANILNSEQAQKIRASMLDGSYKYCNHLECAAMVQGYLYEKSTTTDPVLREAIDHNKLTIDKVDKVLFAFDQTCNLSCPSCRVERIAEKKSLSDVKVKAVEDKLFPLLKTLKNLNINPAGEVFASQQSRRVLEMVNKEDCPDLQIDIISNGTLFTEDEWEKFPNLKGMIRSVRVSTDGCTKPTFEKLRRLGVWEVFTKNLAFLGRLRKENIIPQLMLSFTYQLDNFREMPAFIEFAKSYNCDFVMFERLQNLGAFNWDEFKERAVHLDDHPLHAEFRKIVLDPVFDHIMVWHDFEWDERASKITPDEALERKEKFF